MARPQLSVLFRPTHGFRTNVISGVVLSLQWCRFLGTHLFHGEMAMRNHNDDNGNDIRPKTTVVHMGTPE